MPAIRLNWEEANSNEDGHRIYRSDNPMDPNALPTPLATVAADVTTYDDDTVVTGNTYYYRVSAYAGSTERVSDELEAEASDIGYEDVVLADNPKWYWPMTGGGTSELVAGNNLTFSGGVLAGQGALRPAGDSIYCDGVNDRAYSSTTSLSGDTLSFEIIIKTSATVSARAVTHHVSGSNYRGILIEINDTGILNVHIGDGVGYGADARRSYNIPAGSITANTTYHIVVTASGSSAPTLFIGGVDTPLTFTGGNGLAMKMDSGVLNLGSSPFSTFYETYHSDAAIYDYILTPAQALAHAEAAGLAA